MQKTFFASKDRHFYPKKPTKRAHCLGPRRKRGVSCGSAHSSSDAKNGFPTHPTPVSDNASRQTAGPLPIRSHPEYPDRSSDRKIRPVHAGSAPTDESAVLRKARAGSRIARPSRHSAAHAGRAAPKRRRPLHPAKGPVCAARRPVRFCVRNIRQLVFPISCYGRKRKSSFTVPVANLEILLPRNAFTLILFLRRFRSPACRTDVPAHCRRPRPHPPPRAARPPRGSAPRSTPRAAHRRRCERPRPRRTPVGELLRAETEAAPPAADGPRPHFIFNGRAPAGTKSDRGGSRIPEACLHSPIIRAAKTHPPAAHRTETPCPAHRARHAEAGPVRNSIVPYREGPAGQMSTSSSVRSDISELPSS